MGGRLDRVGSAGRRLLRAGALLGLVLALLVPLVGLAPAASADPTRSPLVAGWVPGWATTTGVAAIEGNADVLGEVSPFWYTAKASRSSATITASASAASIAAVVGSLRARGIPVIPSVADGSAARAMAGLLADPAARSAHVAQLVALVTSNGYEGIELDYERFAFSDGRTTWATTRPAWVAFIAELGNALHAAGKQLALAVPPQYDNTRTSTSGYWVYDYAGIAPYVDSLRIMTYDFSVSRPGPIAPLAFMRRTMAFAITVFPASRLRMGMPAYGRLWTARRPDGSRSVTGTCPTTPAVPGTRSFTTASALGFLTAEAGIAPTVTFDEAAGEAVATFAKQYQGTKADGTPTSCVVDHIAFWVDARGVAARMPLVAEYGLAGVAFWHLGGVDAESWNAMRGFAAGWTPPVPAPVAGVPAPTPPTTTAATIVTVKPSTLTPKPKAKVRLKVRVAPKKRGVLVRRQMLVAPETWRTLASKRTDSKGRVTFTIRWPKKPTQNVYRIVTKARGSVAAGASEQFTIRTR
ncbi:MAG TPA: glycosyl hydrolase family 18 protein [Candidatus Nanopelagicales bacterium]